MTGTTVTLHLHWRKRNQHVMNQLPSTSISGYPLPITLWERVGVRGYGLTIDRSPSPGSHLAMRSDLSHKGRGEVSCRQNRFNQISSSSSAVLQRTTKTSLPRKWRDSLTRCAAAASLSR